MSVIQVIPESLRYDLLLTFDGAISHHDPAIQDDSNRSIFNRQKQFVPAPTACEVSPTTAEALLARFPVPADISEPLADLTLAEYVAVVATWLFVSIYNRRNDGKGEGLFSGMDRYRMLEPRLRQAAVRSHTLRGWWDRLCNDMLVSVHDSRDDEDLIALLFLPRALQEMALAAMARDYRSVVMLARAWSASKEARVPLTGLRVGVTEGAKEIEVPAVQGNTLRNRLVRYPAWLHLAGALDLAPDRPGHGPVLPGVEAIFANGGNIESKKLDGDDDGKKGKKNGPSDTFTPAWMAREAYPSLDLLGGTTDTFDIGESRLKVAGWLVCRENREMLAGSDAADLPMASVSAFDMLDDRVEVRSAHKGVGQMIRNFEVLAPGVQVLVRFYLSPYTPALTRGALLRAVEYCRTHTPFLGGQGARGFGWCRFTWLAGPDAAEAAALAEAYERYLADNRDKLRAGLIDGSLCTGKMIIS